MLSGKLAAEVVWQDERVLAFHHPSPQADRSLGIPRYRPP
jgi:hypothetical protein